MIELADEALEGWLTALAPSVRVTFDVVGATGGADGDATSVATPAEPAGSTDSDRRTPTLTLTLSRLLEQHDRRDNQVDDVLERGRVVARQRATRFFELDYLCTAAGPSHEAHRALGELVQLLVDHDTIPDEFVPEVLREIGHPIDVRLVASPVPAAAVTLQVVLPVRPSADRTVGPPTRSLHLDVGPGPGHVEPVEPSATESDLPAVGDRRWTTVRRRESLGTPTVSEQHDTTGVRRRGG